MIIGSVHGRFQPFHNEHLEYTLEAIKHCNFLWIGITQFDIIELAACDSSPSRSLLFSNPLTYLERITIIQNALLQEGIKQSKFSFIPFPIDQPDKLYQYISNDTICYTTIREEWNKEKINVLRDAGYKTHVLWENYDVKKISSTEIRRLIVSGDDTWKNMVHQSTVEFLLGIDIAKRLNEIK